MSDTPEPTAEEKMADALPANANTLQHTRKPKGLIMDNSSYRYRRAAWRYS
jgi:hypothetical protein